MKHLNDSMELCSITKGENSQIIYLFAEEIHKSFAKGYATELFILFSISAMNIKLNVSAVMNMIALLIDT